MNTSSQPDIDKIEIIYEDDHLLVVNKPNNYLVHHSHYARNIQEATLLDKLKEQIIQPLYPVHRLDRKTSGVLLLAKEKEFVSEIQQLFTDNRIEKNYYAILRGFVDEKLTVDSPVKNDKGIYKDAITHLTCLKQIELDIPVHPYDRSRYSLVKLIPETGRMHQLRIHTNKISHPIIGDYKYGDRFHNRMFEENFDCHYMFLHAKTLSFEHPFMDKQLTLNAGFPADWDIMLNRFGWQLD
tara:strand:- start:63674 stop:64393 length:720 start_codon:yes stop_codon:yes gene_type:complete